MSDNSIDMHILISMINLDANDLQPPTDVLVRQEIWDGFLLQLSGFDKKCKLMSVSKI